MKIIKPDQLLDIKTGNSQLSDVDLFSKLQTSFLEKFFKYNLGDYFSELLANVYEDFLDKKVSSKLQKAIAASLFVVNSTFSIDSFTQKIKNFYDSKSKSISEGHLPFSFKKLFSSCQKQDNTIKCQQLVWVQLKIKAEVQKIEQVPQKIIKTLNNMKPVKRQDLTQLQKMLVGYNKQHLNIFYVYFGDVNFHVFNKKLYEQKTINLMGNKIKLRIFVFFVSKQALIESFRLINKVDNMQYLNDLIIQFYELKREKQRRKRNKIQKKQVKIVETKQPIEIKHIALGILGVVSLTVFGITVKKLFF